MITARFVQLKASRPDTQRKKNETVTLSKQRRTEARLNKSLSLQETEDATGGATDLLGFTRWFNASYSNSGLLDGLAQYEVERFRLVAWTAYHGAADPRVWAKAVQALAIRKREQGIAMEAAYQRRASRRTWPRDSGW